LITNGEHTMTGKTYKIVELVGSSSTSFEEAVQNIVNTASSELTNIRVVEVIELDAKIDNGKIAEYRCKARLSFKVEREPETL
jgi:flavin-binding protein dodecin